MWANLSIYSLGQMSPILTFFGWDSFMLRYTQMDRENRTVALFRCKMAFLKWTFEADPVGVQKRTVSYFKGLE